MTSVRFVELSSSTSLKLLLLVLLLAQNTSYALMRRYSQGVLKETATPSSILLMGELIKLLISLTYISYSPQLATAAPDTAQKSPVVWILQTSGPMVVPAAVYLIMNMLSYVALERIDAGLFTVFAQCKVLSTAVFAYFVMHKSLASRKWRALLLIVLGATLISLQTKPVSDDAFDNGLNSDFMIGIMAVLGEVILSGFISVYFEKVLKKTTTSVLLTVWDRNVQLAIYSICIYLPIALYNAPSFCNILYGWSWVTWIVSLLGSAGGILVALCIKYTSAVDKSMATSGSIVATTYLGYLYLDAHVDTIVWIGAAVVCLAVFNYQDDGESDTSDHMRASSKISSLTSENVKKEILPITTQGYTRDA
eukprot:CFRG1648T1